jgi:hypothetical protein
VNQSVGLLGHPPRLNPIEKAFSKLKAPLRKAAKRDIASLWQDWGK